MENYDLGIWDIAQALQFETTRWQYIYLVLRFFSPEPESVLNVQREDSWSCVLHGGSVSRGHADLDGRHRHRSRGIHAVHDLDVRRDFSLGVGVFVSVHVP